jgi:hypothetical protein
MAYWRYDTHAPVGAAWYTAGNLVALRFLTGRPNLVVHIVGLAPASTAEIAAFAHQAGANGAAGVSLFPAQSVTGDQWPLLATAATTLPGSS